MYEDLKDKVVLVTGSTSAIGKETAKYFASLGSKVVVIGRNEEKVNRIASLCESISPSKHKPLAVICDLNVDGDVEKLMKQTMNTFGQLDVLVNNTVDNKRGKILDENTLHEFDKQMNLNVRSVLHLCRLALPKLVESKGVIVNVSAISKPNPFYLNMCLTNAAIDMLTKVLALEFGPKGVRVNSINPAPLNTDVIQKSNNCEESHKMFPEKNALKRISETREVVNAIAFLSSNVSSFITGALIPIDGGCLLL